MIDPAELRQILDQHCTDKQREAVWLVFVDGLGIKRAARRLNVAPETIRAHLEAARRKVNQIHPGSIPDKPA